MLPLTAKLNRHRGFASRDAERDVPRILPRLLRRPYRFFRRLLEGNVVLPRHCEGVMVSAVIGGAILYGSVVGGQFNQALGFVTAHAGFAVSEIEISGNTHTTPNDVFKALGLNDQRSLISIDPDNARASLVRLPWVGSARIAKVYPDKLEIEIEEREAFALWQQGEALTVVESDGSVIGGYASDARLAALPFLVGKGAADKGAAFIEKVDGYDAISDRVRAYIRVGTRRWNLRLDNGMTIRLPESEIDAALTRLTAMQADLGVLDRDLAAIDLRMKDRTVFALTENARTTRDAFVKARTEAAKKKRKARGSRI